MDRDRSPEEVEEERRRIAEETEQFLSDNEERGGRYIVDGQEVDAFGRPAGEDDLPTAQPDLMPIGKMTQEEQEALQEQAEQRSYPEGEPNTTWRVDELEAYAAERNVDLTGAANKEERVRRLTEGE